MFLIYDVLSMVSFEQPLNLVLNLNEIKFQRLSAAVVND